MDLKMRIVTMAMMGLYCGLLLPAPTAAAEDLRIETKLLRGTVAKGGTRSNALLIRLLPPKLAEDQRSPVNVAIVLDRSGSMAGEKLAKAKQAAKMAIEKLTRKDWISLVTYDDTIEVPVPAALMKDRRSVQARIDLIEAGGTTALFAGVSRGAAELRKHHDPRRVNRLVLLSDGLANVGPSRPEQLAELGASLSKEAIAVTTIGLGLDYNEDLLTRLAMASQGNHSFVAEPEELHSAFEKEFGRGLSVAVQDLRLVLRCAPWVRPVRVMNAPADILDGRVEAHIAQLYSGRSADLLIELEMAPGTDEDDLGERVLAELRLQFAEMPGGTNAEDRQEVKVQVARPDDPRAGKQDKEVRIAVARQRAWDRWLQAVRLRDRGQVKEASHLLSESATFLKEEARATGSEDLQRMGARADKESEDIKNRGVWKLQRKRMQTLQVIRMPSAGY